MTGEDDGVVRFWNVEEGWGVIDCPGTPGGCWTHFSAIEGEGFRAFDEGDTVRVRWESADQDRYDYRATWAHLSS